MKTHWIRWWERKPRAICVGFGEWKKVKVSTPKWDTESQTYRAEANWDLAFANRGERLIFRNGSVYEIVEAKPSAYNTTTLILKK
jgi:hypothetical protein